MIEFLQQLIAISSNDSFTVFENFVVWMNFFGCAFAVYYNYKASSIGIPSLRKAHFIIMGFAVIYLLGYILLLFGDPQFLVWSAWFRGISIAVWPIVWTYPAYVSIKIWNRLKNQVFAESQMEDDK